MTHICVSKLTIIGSDNSLSPGRRQALIWTNDGILLIRAFGTNFSEILSGIQTFSFKKMHLKTSSAKWRPFCLGLNVLNVLLSFYDFNCVLLHEVLTSISVEKRKHCTRSTWHKYLTDKNGKTSRCKRSIVGCFTKQETSIKFRTWLSNYIHRSGGPNFTGDKAKNYGITFLCLISVKLRS